MMYDFDNMTDKELEAQYRYDKYIGDTEQRLRPMKQEMTRRRRIKRERAEQAEADNQEPI